jgi:glutaredoxin-like protein
MKVNIVIVPRGGAHRLSAGFSRLCAGAIVRISLAADQEVNGGKFYPRWVMPVSVLNARTTEFLRSELTETLVGPVRIVFFTHETGGLFIPGRPDPEYLDAARKLLVGFAALSDRLPLEVHDIDREPGAAEEYRIDKVPAIVLVGRGTRGVRFFGIPAGYELVTLVADLADISRGSTSLAEETRAALRTLRALVHIQVFVTPTCPYCPQVVRMAHQMAVESEQVLADMVEASAFPELAGRYGVKSVPTVVINGRVAFESVVPEPTLLAHVLAAEQEEVSAQEQRTECEQVAV